MKVIKFIDLQSSTRRPTRVPMRLFFHYLHNGQTEVVIAGLQFARVITPDLQGSDLGVGPPAC